MVVNILGLSEKAQQCRRFLELLANDYDVDNIAVEKAIEERSGIKQSASIMVNYLYKLSQIEENHELYRGKGVIAASSVVKKSI